MVAYYLKSSLQSRRTPLPMIVASGQQTLICSIDKLLPYAKYFISQTPFLSYPSLSLVAFKRSQQKPSHIFCLITDESESKQPEAESVSRSPVSLTFRACGREFFCFLVHCKADENEAFKDNPVHAVFFAELPESDFDCVVVAKKRVQVQSVVTTSVVIIIAVFISMFRQSMKAASVLLK